jgi:hypothetical protein
MRKEDPMNRRTPSLWLAFGLAVASSRAATAQPAPHNPYIPPPCTGNVFDDITCGTSFDPWIEQYSHDQITSGCQTSPPLYCPNDPVTRAQMAVFVEKAMRGTTAWSPGDLGNENTALGRSAMFSNTTATENTAIGESALGFQAFANGGIPYVAANTAVGAFALNHSNPTATTNGVFNTAMGASALVSNTTGYSNTAVGFVSLGGNGSGFSNTGVGYGAGARDDMVTGYTGSPVPLVPNETGDYNTWIGSAGATAQVDNCTAVGQDAYCDATDQVRLGNFFVNSIGGKVAWSALSDARAKSDVEDLRHGLSFIRALRPVSFRYKGGNGRTDMGFVAQEVEGLLGEGYNVVDAGGDAHRTLSMRYTELIAPLVKAVQEQQAQIDALRAELEALRRARDLPAED